MPFGQSSAIRNDSVNSFYDMAAQVTTTLEAYEPLGNKKDFFHQSAFVGLPDLSLMASSSTPVHYEVSDDFSHYFVMPFKGEANCTIGKNKYLSSDRNGAMMIPGEARQGATTDLSMLQATLSSARLTETARVMLGSDQRATINQHIRQPLMLRFQAGDINFAQVVGQLCALVDEFALSSEALARVGFDDVFYRTLVSWLFQDQLTENSSVARTQAQKSAVENVCDYVDAHLTEAIYLTALENIAGLGARSLQQAFMKRFGCSPMAWVQDRRLQLAHARLQHANENSSVTEIATSCGFGNLGRFALAYRAKFGVSPSDTLKASLY